MAVNNLTAILSTIKKTMCAQACGLNFGNFDNLIRRYKAKQFSNNLDVRLETNYKGLTFLAKLIGSFNLKIGRSATTMSLLANFIKVLGDYVFSPVVSTTCF